ncbi:MAG: tyrosine--tRNA ligase [Dehalococcoidia bacterium]
MAPVDEQLAVLMRGTDFGDESTRLTMQRELAERLEQDRPLRVYCGYDPTDVDLHIGHTITFRKLRQFQDFGHDVTFLIGNFTGLVGDPTDKDKTRPMLSPEQLEANSQSYAEQAFRILDPQRTTVAHNADWLGKLNFADVIAISSKFTVAQFLERDNFQKRYQRHEAIHLSEFMYALMQAYDAVMMETDVQIGGTDQLFNLLAGRTLQRESGQDPQVVITTPLLVGTDGHLKMSKSAGNFIAVNDTPNDMFGKVMSLTDEAIEEYFTLLTTLTAEAVASVLADVEDGELPVMDAKKQLALEVTASMYERDAAEAAQAYFEATIQRRETPEEMQEHHLAYETTGTIGTQKQLRNRLHQVLVDADLAASGGEVRRLVKQGAVRVNGEVVDDFARPLEIEDEIKIGRHKFLRVVAGPV